MNLDEINKRLGGLVIVSRETFERLEIYAHELRRWNPKINLVAANSLPDLWERHILDSLQIAALIKEDAKSWLDVGSGGGFPGLVLAAQFNGTHPIAFNLVESDQRKCSFLRTCARLMKVDVNIIDERIENIQKTKFDVISARALAPLNKLLEMTQSFADADTQFIFPKGKNWESELTFAQEHWQMTVETVQSLTDSHAQIFKLKEVKPNV